MVEKPLTKDGGDSLLGTEDSPLPPSSTLSSASSSNPSSTSVATVVVTATDGDADADAASPGPAFPSASSSMTSSAVTTAVDGEGVDRLEREIGEAIGFGDLVVVHSSDVQVTAINGNAAESNYVNGQDIVPPEPEDIAVPLTGPVALNGEGVGESSGPKEEVAEEPSLVTPAAGPAADEPSREKGEMESASKDDLKESGQEEGRKMERSSIAEDDLNQKERENLILNDEAAKESRIQMEEVQEVRRERHPQSPTQLQHQLLQHPTPPSHVPVSLDASAALTDGTPSPSASPASKKEKKSGGEMSPSKKSGVNGSASVAGNTGFLRAARAGNMEKMKEFMRGKLALTRFSVVVVWLSLRSAVSYWSAGHPCFCASVSCDRSYKNAGHASFLPFTTVNSFNINVSNANGLNALHLASKEGHLDIVNMLLEKNAFVDGSTARGNTALHIASLAGGFMVEAS